MRILSLDKRVPPPPNLKEIDPETATQAINTLNVALKDNPDASVKIKNKLKRITKEYLLRRLKNTKKRKLFYKSVIRILKQITMLLLCI